MVLPLDPSSEYRYISDEDKELPREEQTVFSIRPLTAKEEAFVMDSFIDMEADADMATPKIKSRVGQRTITVLNIALLGWSNFRLPDAKEDMPFKVEYDNPRDSCKRRISDKTLSRLPAPVRIELANAITENLGMTEEDLKNSDTQSGHSQEKSSQPVDSAETATKKVG